MTQEFEFLTMSAISSIDEDVARWLEIDTKWFPGISQKSFD